MLTGYGMLIIFKYVLFITPDLNIIKLIASGENIHILAVNKPKIHIILVRVIEYLRY